MSVALSTDQSTGKLPLEFAPGDHKRAFEPAAGDYQRHVRADTGSETKGHRLLETAVAAGLEDGLSQKTIATELGITKTTVSRVAKALCIRRAYPTETRRMTWVQLGELPCPLKCPDLLASLLREPAIQTMGRDQIRQLRIQRRRATEPQTTETRARDRLEAKINRLGLNLQRSASRPRAWARHLRAAWQDPELSVALGQLIKGGRT